MGKTVLVVAGAPYALVAYRGPLLRAMVAKGHRVIACASPEDVLAGLSGDFRSRLDQFGVEFRPIRVDRTGVDPRNDFITYKDIKAVIEDVKPDVTMSFSMKAVVWTSFAAKSANVPHRVALISGVGLGIRTEGQKLSLPTRIGRRLYRLAIQRNTHVIFQNSDDCELHFKDKFLPPGFPVTVVNCSGVDLSKFEPSTPSTDPLTFVLIARLLLEKGLREYAGAARILKEKWPEARFILIGPFDDHPDAIKQAEVQQWVDDGFIEYPGATPDVRGFLRDSSVYVLPSYYREGIPLTILEAMATGRPIITTDHPGCRQTVERGLNGFLVPTRDTEATAKAMEQFLENPELAVTMGRESRRLAEQKFDVNQVNHEMLVALKLD